MKCASVCFEAPSHAYTDLIVIKRSFARVQNLSLRLRALKRKRADLVTIVRAYKKVKMPKTEEFTYRSRGVL